MAAGCSAVHRVSGCWCGTLFLVAIDCTTNSLAFRKVEGRSSLGAAFDSEFALSLVPSMVLQQADASVVGYSEVNIVEGVVGRDRVGTDVGSDLKSHLV